MARIKTLAMLSSEDNGASPGVEMTDEAIEAVVEDPAIAAATVNDDATQLELDSVVSEESAADADVLEEVADTLEEATENGEVITGVAAECLRVLVQHIADRRQIQAGVNIARESFGNKAAGLQAQRLAMLSIQNIAKDIWKQIVKAYEAVIAFVKKWWAKFFDGATKLRDRAESMEKAFKSKKSTIEKDAATKKVDVGDWINLVQDGTGKFDWSIGSDTVGSLVGTYNLNTNISARISTLADTVAEAMKDPAAATTGKSKVIEEAVKIREKQDANNMGEAPDGMVFAVSDSVVGGKCIYTLTPKTGASEEDVLDNIGRMKIWMDEKPGYKDVAATDLPLTDASAYCENACKNVYNLAVTMIKGKEKSDSAMKVANKLKDRANKLAGMGDDEDKSDDIRTIGKIARACVGMISASVSAINNHFLQVGNAHLSAVAAIISAGSSKTKEDKKNAIKT